MSMSKKDFIALADALRNEAVPGNVINALADFCQRQNPRFNRGRWLDYINYGCGPSGGKIKKPRRFKKTQCAIHDLGLTQNETAICSCRG